MIRKSRETDLRRLYEIWTEAVKATHHFLDNDAFSEIADLVKDKYLPSRVFDVYVNEDDIALGFMGATGNEVESLFIHPDHFGKGIGRTFINMMKEAHADVTLEVNEQNPQAVGFYKACGFDVIRRDPTDDHGRPFPILHMVWKK